MNTRSLVATSLVVGTALFACMPAFAQYESVETRTTTTTSTLDPLAGNTTYTKRTIVTPSQPTTVVVPASATIVTDGSQVLSTTTSMPVIVRRDVVLPATTTYVMVDPLTGVQRGIYNPATGVTTTLPSGVVLAERSTNRVVAMVDNGRLVEVTSMPTLTGSHVVLRNGVWTYLDETDYKIMVMERSVDDEYKAGRLSTSQVSDLKQRINEASSWKARYSKNGSLSDSRMRTLVSKIDAINTRMAKDVAYINGKRADIGIRVN
ncbi:MAG: hypothetical protein QG625_1302 [Cyanobacteriota bacterium erpe_2018_sw_39hr_WHONDRS-SW48-000098_B_bin.30]|nr:hypothetical protein [Cyanobacteriota bacterium erpe_2018_sw_39hr_WHONDRS-SW48-000098_B_bin.30]